MPAVSETFVTDGRASRAHRTRDAVVDALLELIDGGNLRPTAKEVAEAAGVSLRSVYVHFDDVEALFLTASARHHERIQALPGLQRPLDRSAPLAARVDQIVTRRRDVHERGAQVRRAALVQEPFSPALRRALDYGRAAARAETEAVFAPELAAVTESERPRLRAALDTTLGGAMWDQLRAHQGFSADEAAALVRDMLTTVLAGWGATTGAPSAEPGPDQQQPPHPPTAGSG